MLVSTTSLTSSTGKLHNSSLVLVVHSSSTTTTVLVLNYYCVIYQCWRSNLIVLTCT